MAIFIEAEGALNIVNAASFRTRHLQRLSTETLECLQGAAHQERIRNPQTNPMTTFTEAQINFLNYVHNCVVADTEGELNPGQLATGDRLLPTILLASLAERVVQKYHMDIQALPKGHVLTPEQFNPTLSKLLKKIVSVRMNEGRRV